MEGPVEPLDWKLVADLAPGDLLTRLSAEVNALMADADEPAEDALLARLPEPLRAMWLMDWLDYEVSQGSLSAYFFNSHGRHAASAVDLLRRMGAYRMADVVSTAAAVHAENAADWRTRHAELDAAGEHAVGTPYAGLPGAGRLGELTDQFWQAAVVDDWGGSLNAYLKAQIDLLVD